MTSLEPSKRSAPIGTWGSRQMRSPRAGAKRYNPSTEDLRTGKSNKEGQAQAFSSIDHGGLGGLSDDDHTQYAMLVGRSGGQTIKGGTGASQDLNLQGTSHATPGIVNVIGGLRCDSIANDTGLAAGVYTPTRSAEANLDSSAVMTQAQYMRLGNTVTVSGRFTADPTTTLTTTSFEITLPVASDLGAIEDLAGVAFCGSIAAQGAEIIGVVANNTAKVQWKAADVTSQTWSYTFTYRVI